MKLSHPDAICWIALTHVRELGLMRQKKLLQHFNGVRELFTATSTELLAANLSTEQINAIKNISWEDIENDLRWCEQHHCQLLTYIDDDYPAFLKEMSDSPIMLYVLGEIALLNQPQIAIVGSRNPTSVGKETALEFAGALSRLGLVITSGLALGIDKASHEGALNANGKTIAVMGTGLNQIYPKSNALLAEKIISTGALVSEFSINTPAHAKLFPIRNRIISGLSMGVLVVEAALSSGSLITARYAVDQGREVFAIPGSIHHPLAKGCHQLIKQGAKIVENVEDILVELAPLQECLTLFKQQEMLVSVDSSSELTDEQTHFLQQLGYEVTPVNTLFLRSGLTSGQVSSMLLALELKGFVDSVPGGYIRRR